MKSYRIIVLGVAALVAAACAKTSVKAVIDGAADAEIVVKALDVNKYTTVDTLKTDAEGVVKFNLDVKKGDPEFFYLFYGDTKIASLLLEKGDKVEVKADTLGIYSVEGSEECFLLQQVENDYSAFLSKIDGLAWRLTKVDENSTQAGRIKHEMSDDYVAYYRDRVKFILEHPTSLTIVPIFYQNLGDMAIFSQETDAVYFAKACESLEEAYPASRYVKSLRSEAKNRQNLMDLSARLRTADAIDYPEVELPDINGNKISLTATEAKLLILHLWTTLDPEQSMFNLDVFKPLYEKYHSSGLEIYSVAIDADKASWAQVMKNQSLGWINVCDSRGSASPYLMSYNVTSLPMSYFIGPDGLIDEVVNDEKELEALVAKYLK